MSKTINSITVAALTAVQAAIIMQARAAAPGKKDAGADQRKQIKREVYGVAKDKFGIPSDVKVSAVVNDSQSPNYLVLHAAGRRNPKRGMALRLGADGKWDGTYVTKDQLFPPPAPAPVLDQAPATTPRSSLTGEAPKGNWFRLDAAQVAAVLTADGDDEDQGSGAINRSTEGGDLPIPFLMLKGRDDLAIVADGSIYRRIA